VLENSVGGASYCVQCRLILKVEWAKNFGTTVAPKKKTQQTNKNKERKKNQRNKKKYTKIIIKKNSQANENEVLSYITSLLFYHGTNVFLKKRRTDRFKRKQFVGYLKRIH
jgi:hypothetical protein